MHVCGVHACVFVCERGGWTVHGDRLLLRETAADGLLITRANRAATDSQQGSGPDSAQPWRTIDTDQTLAGGLSKIRKYEDTSD